MTTTVSPRQVYLDQQDKCMQVQQPEFLDAFVRPHYRGAPHRGGTWQTDVIQLDGSGAATVRCSLDGGHPVFAKVFPFDDGPDVYRKLREFRAAGLGAGSRYQSVEPLAWYDEHQLLLCEGAPGVDLETLFVTDRAAWQAGIRDAGAWLGTFHSSGLAIGEYQPLLVTSELTSLAKRLGKAMAEQPQHLELALRALAVLDTLSFDTRDGLHVQSHGQYRAKHVFTDSSTVTVIDLDRSAPADPARDVAEFIQRMRTDAFEIGGELGAAEAATRDFLESYAAAAGSEDYLANFRFHYARHVVHRINRVIKKGILGTAEDTSSQFLLAELEQVRTGSFA